MIPKIMNFYWASEKMSWLRYMTLFSFKKMNPDWECILHVNEKDDSKTKTWKDIPIQDFFNFDGINFYSKIKDLGIEIRPFVIAQEFPVNLQRASPPQQSDLFTWKLLSSVGGFYSDLDILYIKSLDSWYESVKRYDIISSIYEDHACIGFLGSSPENKYYMDIYDISKKEFDINLYESVGALSIHKLLKKNKDLFYTLLKEYSTYNIYNIPQDLFYYFKWDSKAIFKDLYTRLPDCVLGIHWYGGDPIYSQKSNNIINESNYVKIKNTFCYFASKIMGKENNFLKNNRLNKPWLDKRIYKNKYHTRKDIVKMPILNNEEFKNKFFNGKIWSIIKTIDAEDMYALDNFATIYSCSFDENTKDLVEYIINSKFYDIGGFFCDVGASRGKITSVLIKNGFVNSFAIDGSDFGIRTNNIDCPLENYCVCDLSETLIFKEFYKKFNFITCFETLEHIDPSKIDIFVSNLFYMSDNILCSVHLGKEIGEENHCNIKDFDFWKSLFKRLCPKCQIQECFIKGVSQRWEKSKFLLITRSM